MKSRLCVLFLALAALASGQVVSEQLVRIQTDPAGGRVQAFFEKTVTVDGVAYRQPWTEVSWPLASEQLVTIALPAGGSVQVTRAAIFAAVVAIAQEEKNAPPPTPAPDAPPSS